MRVFLCRSRSAVAFVLLAASVSAQAQTLAAPRDAPYPGVIGLQVDATDVDHRVLRVRETLPVTPGPLTLLYPEWIPGTHGPTNEVKRLTGLRIGSGSTVLAWQRDPARLSAFRVEVPAGVSSLDLEFTQVLPSRSDGYAALLTRKFAGLQWQGAVLYPAGWATARIAVDLRLRLPAGWQQASALRPAAQAGGETRYERVSLETLIDSPLFAGPHFKRIDLDPGSARPIHLDVFAEDAASLETTEEQIEAHRSLVRQADRLFGARHYAHYDLMMLLGDATGGIGLEHHQSSENGVRAGYFTEWKKTRPARDLLPHEYAHSWNGKFRRPRDLWSADLNTPTGNSLLWVYEGQTEYWGEVLATRSGLLGLDDARDRLAQSAAWFQILPGRSWRSLQDTVHDEVISGRHLALDWSSWQRFEDYYSEGALIWLDADTRIRELSAGQRSLDDFARGFFGVEDGRVEPLLYDFDDVVAALARVQPYDWASFLRSRLDGVGTPAPLDGLARSGWRLGWTEKPSDYAKTAQSLFEFDDFLFSLGFSVGKEARIGGVLWDSPAFKAGLGKGATLIAVNLRAYKAEVLSDAITANKQGKAPIDLLLQEGDDFRIVRIDYRGGLRYPRLERIDGTPDTLTAILSPR